jgi:hypothetical protein
VPHVDLDRHAPVDVQVLEGNLRQVAALEATQKRQRRRLAPHPEQAEELGQLGVAERAGHGRAPGWVGPEARFEQGRIEHRNAQLARNRASRNSKNI